MIFRCCGKHIQCFRGCGASGSATADRTSGPCKQSRRVQKPWSFRLSDDLPRGVAVRRPPNGAGCTFGKPEWAAGGNCSDLEKLQLDWPEAALPRCAGVMVVPSLRRPASRCRGTLRPPAYAQLHLHTSAKDSAQAVKPDVCRCAAFKKKNIFFTTSRPLPSALTLFRRGTAKLTRCFKQLSQPMPCLRCLSTPGTDSIEALPIVFAWTMSLMKRMQVGSKLCITCARLEEPSQSVSAGSRWKATSSKKSSEALPRRFKPRHVSTVRASHDIQDVTRVARTDQRSQDHFLRLFTR